MTSPRARWRFAAPALFAWLALGCSPTLRGRCTGDTDCRTGAVCAASGICISASGTCSPACPLGQLCSSGTCTPLNASVEVELPSPALLGPQRPLVAVRVAAAPGVVLGTLELDVDQDAAHREATATLDSPQQGKNMLTLGGFDPNHAGPVTVLATLPFTDSAGNAGRVRSVAVEAFYDSQAPSVAVFVPAQDSVGGWFPRTGPDVEVRAQVDDLGGSGPASASLTFSSCPASSACTLQGALLGSAQQGTATYSFLLPRTVQTEGSETPIAFTVRAIDQAGNIGFVAGTLQIDDKAPALGPARLVTQGALGEDGKVWFPGGPSGVSVEVAVALSDLGAGLQPASVALLLDQADVDAGTPSAALRIPANLPLPGDGTAHFTLSTAVTSGREGPLHFSVAALDKLGHAQLFRPASPIVFVDDLAPAVTLAHVDYANAVPALASVCAAGVICGRAPAKGAPDHLLRDDWATVTFDAVDCGAGLGAPAQPGFTASTGLASVSGAVMQAATSASSCASKNPVHHYSFQLRLPEHAPALDPSDASGSTKVLLVGHVADLTANPADSGAPDGSGDGLALVSVWRWKTQLPHLPTGAGVLLPGPSSPRRVVVGTAHQGALDPNLFAYGADGALSFSAIVNPAIAGDLSVGASGTIYAVSGNQCSGGQTCSTFNEVLSGTSATVLPSCSIQGLTLGAPPTILDAALPIPERAVAVATLRDSPATENVYVFESKGGTGCKRVAKALLLGNGVGSIGELTGISSGTDLLFASHGAGFTSLGISAAVLGATEISYETSAAAPPAAKAPPALSFGPALQPIFASASDQRLRATSKQQLQPPCLTPNECWSLAPGFTEAVAGAPLSSTPVFDAVSIYAADDLGTVFAWALGTGAQQGKVALAQAVSAPILLDGAAGLNPLLVLAADGKVHLINLITPQGAVDQVLLQTAAFASTTPYPPSVDRRDLKNLAGAVIALGGVAYLTDGLGFLWALQVARAPLAASNTAWPRPGRDSCNSRSLGSSCP